MSSEAAEITYDNDTVVWHPGRNATCIFRIGGKLIIHALSSGDLVCRKLSIVVPVSTSHRS